MLKRPVYIYALSGLNYAVEWQPQVLSQSVLRELIKYHARYSSNFEIAFILDHGVQKLNLSLDSIFLTDGLRRLIEYLEVYDRGTHSITGVIVKNREEAVELQDLIEKTYMWEVLHQ